MAITHRKRSLIWLLPVVAIGLLWACWWPGLTSPTGEPSGESAQTGKTTSPPLRPIIAAELHRKDLSPGESAAVTTAAVADDTPDFDTLLERLVEITVAANTAALAGESAGVQRLDQGGSEVLRQILHRVEEPDAQALHKLTGLMSEDHTTRGLARRGLCVGILDRGLRRRLERFEHGGSRVPLDELVLSMLDCIPQDETVARELAGLLTDTPFLGVAHEAALLDLVATASEDRYLIPIVTDLLETLWQNLEAAGARTARDLINLAMLFRVDANPAKRLVALRHLLLADNGRYRELVMQETMAKNDAQLVAELTRTVASELPPREAISALERLSTVATGQLMSAFLTLGGRKPEVLVDAYERKLADGTRPDFRAELVTGAGFQGGEDGLRLARLAFAEDPDPTVRARAMFVISGQASATEGEKTLMQALDSKSFAANPRRLSEVVLALQNLAAAGDPNAVDRVGRRLRNNPRLSAADRRRLELILDRTLPDPRAGPKKGIH